LVSENGESARARLIRTRHGTWIDKRWLPEVRKECLEILREAAREAVGEDTYLPGWISDACDSVSYEADDLSRERLGWEWEPTPAQQKKEEETEATIEALRSRGAFKGLSMAELFSFLSYISESIGSRYEAQVACEVEEAASRRRPIPKSNPTLITEKDLLDLTLDVLHSYGVLDSIIELDFVRGAAEEEWEAGERARGARARRSARRDPALRSAPYLRHAATEQQRPSQVRPGTPRARLNSPDAGHLFPCDRGHERRDRRRDGRRRGLEPQKLLYNYCRRVPAVLPGFLSIRRIRLIYRE
jgi:hypothetical protein